MQIRISGKDCATKILSGVREVADLVALTMGPSGRNVSVNGVITNDGVTVANAIVLDDPAEKLGADIVKEVANKTNKEAGDGTTTSCVLTNAILEEAMLAIKGAVDYERNKLNATSINVNPLLVREGIMQATEDVVTRLKNMAQPVSQETLVDVAFTSVESKELAELIASTVKKIGFDGSLSMGSSPNGQTYVEEIKGMSLHRGVPSRQFIFDATTASSVLDNANVVVVDKKIASPEDLIPVYENFYQKGIQEAVIICHDLQGEAMTFALRNKMSGQFTLLPVQAPGFNDKEKTELLQDIAIACGATLFSESTGKDLRDFTVKDAGKVGKIIAKLTSAELFDTKGNKKDIKDRVTFLKKEKEMADSERDREKLSKRIGSLTGSIATIMIGGITDSEHGYIRYKVEDAINATRGALRDGIVPGCGKGLVIAARQAQISNKDARMKSRDFATGYCALLNACTTPMETILENMGASEAQIEKVYEDTVSGQKLRDGVYDPASVVVSALRNAASAVGVLITTDAIVVDVPDKE